MQPTFEGVPWRALQAAATHCEVVLFTIISGEYDDLSKFVASQRRAHDERDARGRAAHVAHGALGGPWHTMAHGTLGVGPWRTMLVYPLPFP